MVDEPVRGADYGGGRGQACNTCTHVFPGHSFCEAFPDGDGIPVLILNGLSHHTEPWDGDHGMQYEYAPGLGLSKPAWAP